MENKADCFENDCIVHIKRFLQDTKTAKMIENSDILNFEVNSRYKSLKSVKIFKNIITNTLFALLDRSKFGKFVLKE